MFTITQGKVTFTGNTKTEAEAMQKRFNAYFNKLAVAYPLAKKFAQKGNLTAAYNIIKAV